MSSGSLAFVVFLVSISMYLVFAGQVSSTEAAAGVPAAGLVAAYAGLRHRGESRPMRLRGPWLRLLLSPMASVAGDAARVGAHLLRAVFVPGSQVAGTISRQPFRSGDAGPPMPGGARSSPWQVPSPRTASCWTWRRPRCFRTSTRC